MNFKEIIQFATEKELEVLKMKIDETTKILRAQRWCESERLFRAKRVKEIVEERLAEILAIKTAKAEIISLWQKLREAA